MRYIFHDNNITTEFGHGTLSIAKDAEFGFRPYQLLISSIVGCSGLVFQNILQKQRIELEEFSIFAEVERNEQEANRVEKIELTFYLRGKDLDEKKLHRNLDLSRKHCSMIRSVEKSIHITEKLQINKTHA